MQETKATRLQELSTVVPVPIFFVLDRGDHFHKNLLTGDIQYMVRSSTDFEDQQYSSQAGQSKTYGPLKKTDVEVHIAKLFENPRVTQVIIQNYVKSSEGSGVAFCFDRDQLYVEYARKGEGVTAGTVKPYVALLPTKIPRYEKLTAFLQKLHDHYGLCDVEFIGLTDPQFVQVRPVTQSFELDTEYISLQMQLQELHEHSWVENDVCRVMAEHDMKASHFSEVYLRAMKNITKKYFKKQLRVPAYPFIKIGEQFYMSGKLAKKITPRFKDLLRLAFAMPSLRHYLHTTPLEQYTLAAAMEYSIILSFIYTFMPSKKIFALRQQFRFFIDKKLKERPFTYALETPLKLSADIISDDHNNVWIAFGKKEDTGVIVVPGNFVDGPFFDLHDPQQKIPPGVIVRTKQLYPEIGRVIADVRGVICENGALTSHVAILAREHDIPLKIQAKIS